ncbi:MAG: ATP-binding protein [Chloroflexota bacterium]
MQPTSFIGREQEQPEVKELLQTHHLVTITGSGGAGKTRLALQVAGTLVTSYSGVWLAELAPLDDAALVPQEVASALGVRALRGHTLSEAVAAFFSSKRMLLVLDNCEHLIEACAELISFLLRSCPELRVLATSREGLRVPGEVLYQVPSLSLPDTGDALAPRQLLTFEAIALFVERGRERRATFELTDADAPAVFQICRRLDGIPLAIELAAARIGVLTAQGIAGLLDDAFRLLTGGPRTVLPRQQTLRATFDWSHQLLSEAEQILFRRLSVFTDGCTLEAAEAIHADSETLDHLDGLVGKSLVLMHDEGETPWYRLLEMVRQYGYERLEAAGEEVLIRDRHLQWYLALSARAEQGLAGAEQGTWLARLEREHDNLRAALAWSVRRPGQQAAGMELAARLLLFWEGRGHVAEARRRLEELLACDRTAPAATRARALHCAGALAGNQGDYGGAAQLLEESLVLQRALADELGIARVLQALGLVTLYQGAYDRAIALCEENLALRRSLGDRWGIAAALDNLGVAAYLLGNYEQATMLHEESLALRRELGNKRGIAGSLGDLGLVAHSQGDYNRAEALLAESLALRRELGDKGGIAGGLADLGAVSIAQGDYGRAAGLLEESLELCLDLGDKQTIAGCLESTAALALAEQAPRRAAELFGAAEALREHIGSPLPPPNRAEYERNMAAVSATLGTDVADAILSRGRALSLESAVAVALASPDARSESDPGS